MFKERKWGVTHPWQGEKVAVQTTAVMLPLDPRLLIPSRTKENTEITRAPGLPAGKVSRLMKNESRVTHKAAL